MRALVLYESMFGNTASVARAVAAGLGDSASIRGMREVRGRDFDAVDLVVIGGPTHERGMTQFATRRRAEQLTQTNGHRLDPQASIAIGLRDLFRRLRTLDGVAGAAFDTRHRAPLDSTGSAAVAITRRLRRNDAIVVAEPMSFFVDDRDRLLRGEVQRATEFGESLAAGMQALL